MKIIIDKEESLIDEEIKIKITDIKPESIVTLMLETKDYYAVNVPIRKAPVGTLWRSRAEFKADSDGSVILYKQAPVSGDYNNVDSMGLLTHMKMIEPEEENLISSIDKLPEYRKNHFLLKVIENDKVIGEKEFTRCFCMDEILSKDIDFGKMKARFFIKDDKEKHPAVMVFSGSDGRIEKAQAIAETFAQHGYGALAVGYFGMDGMSDVLVDIPIECIGEIIKYLQNDERIDSDRIGIYGRSKGGELALLAASLYPQITKVVAVMPSCYVYSGLKKNVPSMNHSSWSFNGKEIPFLKYGYIDSMKMIIGQMRKDKFAMTKLARRTFMKKNHNKDAMINLEKINGDILLITSEDDTVWPSKEYGEIAIKYLKEKNFKHKAVQCNYSKAGHMIILPNQSFASLDAFGGGEIENCIKATRKAWNEILKFYES